MILVIRTYTETTPESAEAGEPSACGLIVDDEPCTFRELVQLMKDHFYPSCSPARGETFEWYSTGYHTTCYETGTERNESIHFSRNNTPRAAKYWLKAARAAGIV